MASPPRQIAAAHVARGFKTPVPPRLSAALRDRYQLEGELGRGGMATVFLARDLRHDRQVALKVLRPELAAVLGRERFLAEVRHTARLDHPHILTLIDSGESDGFLWYVLPLVRGESLRHRLDRERQLGVAEALAIACDIAAALAHAHQQDIVHRDVKPENILLHEGEAVLTDFGIALALHEAGGERLTETGLSVGTPPYMSPEQAAAESRLDARTDIYSLGAVLYEMLAGEPPFTGASAQAVIAKLMALPPAPVRTLRDTVPPQVEAAITRALAKVPADRFPTAAAFGAALQEAGGTGAGTTERPPQLPVGTRRLPRWAWLAAAGALAGLAGLALLAPRLRAPPSPRADPAFLALDARARHELDRRTGAGTVAAIADYSALLRRDSAWAPAWTGLAQSYQRAYIRNFALPGISRDSALRLGVVAAERAVAADSGSAEAWVAQAMVSRAVDPTDLTPVFRAVRRALALDSLSAQGWHILALSLAESGDFPGAMQAWDRSVTLQPGNVEIVTWLGQAGLWRHQYDSAQRWLDSALTLDANYLMARNLVGFVAVEQGDAARAAASFDAARRLADDVEIPNQLAGNALAAARAGQPGKARLLLREADSLATAYAPAPLHTTIYLASAHADLGEVDQAISWLERYEYPRDLHFQVHLRCDPALEPVARDPRFLRLLRLARPPTGTGC